MVWALPIPMLHIYQLGSRKFEIIDSDWTVLLIFCSFCSQQQMLHVLIRCLGLETLWYQVPCPKYKQYLLNVYWYCNRVFIRYFETLWFTLVFVWSSLTCIVYIVLVKALSKILFPSLPAFTPMVGAWHKQRRPVYWIPKSLFIYMYIQYK